MNAFFITGIGTEIGKTVVSAILVEALKADYWKPIQAGNLEFTDSDFIRMYTKSHQNIRQEAYSFSDGVSPHLAAKLNDQIIDIELIKINKLSNNLIIEGAGGLMVPLNNNYLIKDLIKNIQIPVIVVSKNYLGSINHTILTIETLKQHNIEIAGIIFNGDANIESENYILNYTGVKLLGKIPKADIMSKGFVIQQAELIRENIVSLLDKNILPPVQNDITIDYESF